MMRLWLMRMTLAAFAIGGLMQTPVWAQATGDAADCTSFEQVDRRKTYEADSREVQECKWRAWDPPLKWRKNDGKSAGIAVGGSGGFSIGSRHAPDQPPGKAGGRSSVNGPWFDFTLRFPPWRGFPCQLPGGRDLCGGGGDDDDDDETTAACLVASDTTGIFGVKHSLSGGLNLGLNCGGAIPLATYQMTLNPSPTGLFATEYGAYSHWSYIKQGNGFKQAASGMLPAYLCKDGKKSVDLKPAVAQMITYTASTPYIAVRLMPADPLNPPDTWQPSDPTKPEKFLIVPIRGGVPDMPADCAREADYYKPMPAASDALMIETTNSGGCMGTPEECGQVPGMPEAPPPSTTGSCDVVTLNPTGSTQTSAGSNVVCDGKVLFAALDRPSVILPPGSSVQAQSIEGRTAVMVPSTQGSRLYAQFDTVIRLGSSQEMNFPEGAVVRLKDGNLLHLDGPAKIRAASRQAVLTNGGTVQTVGGSIVQTIAAGSMVNIHAELPLVVRMNRNVDLPAGFALPTQPNPYVQLPMDAPAQ